jgi:hypothetical protein
MEIAMSMDIYVCWQGAFAPSRVDLTDALKKVGFDATVLHDFIDEEGYWPIDIEGMKTGVEAYRNEDLAGLREDYPVLSAVLGDRDRGATFTFGGDPAECGVAMALAAASAQLCDAVIYEPSEGVIYLLERAVQEARRSFEEAKKEGYDVRQD